MGQYRTPLNLQNIKKIFLKNYFIVIEQFLRGKIQEKWLLGCLLLQKINKGKGLRTVISENLENCCKLINIPFHQVGASKTQMNENPKLRIGANYTFDQIVERVDRKYRRVMDTPDVKREFNKWRKEEFRRKEFNDFLKKPTPINKK